MEGTMTETPRILLVEDDIALGQLTADALDVIGFDSVEHVLDVESALTAMADDAFDICILDIRLQSGTCTAVVEAANERDLPVILTSGMNDSDQLGVQPTRSQFLRKPVPMEQWSTAIRDLVNQPG